MTSSPPRVGTKQEYRPLANPDEFASIRDEYRRLDRWKLEAYALDLALDRGGRIGTAKAEIVRRDREYADEQEQSRREWETKHQAARQEFEEELAKRQMDHAAALAREQLDIAQAAALAAKMAAWAAAASAIGAIGQLIVAIFVK